MLVTDISIKLIEMYTLTYSCSSQRTLMKMLRNQVQPSKPQIVRDGAVLDVSVDREPVYIGREPRQRTARAAADARGLRLFPVLRRPHLRGRPALCTRGPTLPGPELHGQ